MKTNKKENFATLKMTKKMNPKGVFNFNSNKNYFRLYIDKNNSLFDIERIQVLSWKMKGKKRIPDQISGVRDRKLFDMLYGQPRSIVERKLDLICSFE